MNEHNLDDLIIGNPAPVDKKSKSFLAMIALAVIVLLVGILLYKMIFGTSEDDITLAETNQTTFVSPDVVPPKTKKQEQSSEHLKPIGRETLPTPEKPKKSSSTKKPAKKPTKKPVVVVKPKKPIKKPQPKKQPIKRPIPKKPSAPSALFGKGKPLYYIQIGAFNREPNPKFLKKIEGAGLKYIVNKNEKTRRVRVGPYGSYAEAKAALIDVNSSVGVMGFVVKQK